MCIHHGYTIHHVCVHTHSSNYTSTAMQSWHAPAEMLFSGTNCSHLLNCHQWHPALPAYVFQWLKGAQSLLKRVQEVSSHIFCSLMSYSLVQKHLDAKMCHHEFDGFYIQNS